MRPASPASPYGVHSGPSRPQLRLLSLLPSTALSCHIFFSLYEPQIRKSEKNLLERLFTVIHNLTPTQVP